jgi:hypothetical protein
MIHHHHLGMTFTSDAIDYCGYQSVETNAVFVMPMHLKGMLQTRL